MEILNEILAWSTNDLKPWQSDAIRRLFMSHDLREDDFTQLLAMLKKSKGFDVEAPEPFPLLAEHLPVIETTDSKPRLVEICELRSVNRLSPNTTLRVAETGATVIYGDNGSGKSGFSRIIKSACRARVKGEPVLGDVRLELKEQGTPRATFKVKAADNVQSVFWEQGQKAPQELAHVAIFDSKCARAYTDSEGDFIFLPSGLEVLEKLVRAVFPELEGRVSHEVNLIDISPLAFQDLSGQTAVGELFRTISARTEPAKVEALAIVSETDIERLNLLEKTLAEKDPLERAKRTREVAGWIQAAAQRINQRVLPFNNEAAQSYARLDKSAEDAINAEKAAAQALRSGEYLIDGTGDSAWKSLFEAAVGFAAAHQHPHPGTASEGETCVLCQQHLSDDGAARLRRFGEFILKDASRQATSRVNERKRARDDLDRQSHLLNLEEATLDLIKKRRPDLAEAIRQFEAHLELRKASLLASFDNHTWQSPVALAASPEQALLELAEHQLTQASVIAQSADPAKRVQLEKERAELQARQKLSGRKDALLALIGRMKAREGLSKCLNDLKSRPISNKAISLTQNSVTQELTNALNDEFHALGISTLQAKMVTRIEQGKPKVKLILNFPGAVKPEQVLSEGEQRAVAIASFLAELRTAKHSGPLIFDDPVSSLDHRRRTSVAERLIEEAKHRQVLIFTHDAVFLSDLLRASKTDNVPLLTQHLGYSPKAAGIVYEGLPWLHLPYNDRMDKLEKLIHAARRDWPEMEAETAESRIRIIYGRMREICERIVQDVAFEGVIERFNNYIRVPNLIKVAGLEIGPCSNLVLHWQKASDVTLGHDKASAGQGQLPTAEDALIDLKALRATVADFKRRHAAARTEQTHRAVAGDIPAPVESAELRASEG